MAETVCPICWKQRDGPFPCAFLKNMNVCTRNDPYHSCIDIHRTRYNEAISHTTILCIQCGYPIDITKGEREKLNLRNVGMYCHACSEVFVEDAALAAHIRGDI